MFFLSSEFWEILANPILPRDGLDINCTPYQGKHVAREAPKETSQELQMLSSVTINCQVTKIVINPGSQLSEL